MAYVFEILWTTSIFNRGQFIFARSIDGELDFDLKDSATLGGIPIYPFVEMPRLLDDNKQPRLDVFVFRAVTAVPLVNFVEGQRVELVLGK